MKRILKITAFALIVMLGGSLSNTASAQPDYNENDDVSYQTFYDELSPHGRWIEYPEYGYVWAPNAGSDFRPYQTNGHWVWTEDYESMWVSDYSWGWAPFHYGRWFYDPFYGWMWVPGYEWSPAWVAWRHGGDYYGWAPIRPGFNISINIGFGNYHPPVDYWCFAPRRYINSPHIYNHYVDRSRNVTIINNTTIININNRRNNVFGPRRIDAERYAGRINPVRFRESSRPGRTIFRNNEVSVYRPRVQRDNNRQIAPRNFDRYERNDQRRNVFDRGRDNASARSNNNLPSRENQPGSRVFDRRNNNEAPQPRIDNNNQPERRNVFDRNNSNRSNNEVRPQQENNNERRRNVFDRNNSNRSDNEVRPQQENNNERRRNVFDRNRTNSEARPQQQENNERRPSRVEPQATPQQPQAGRNEQRRNVFDRGRENNAGPQPRREIRNEAPVQRQSQNEPRSFENRRMGSGDKNNNGNPAQRGGDNNDRGRRFGRR